VQERNAGPHHVSDAVANYVASEQSLGRLRADADPRAAADLLLGACFQQAFLSRFTDTPMDDETRGRTAIALTQTLLSGLAAPS
jgi:hypothetical protein